MLVTGGQGAGGSEYFHHDKWMAGPSLPYGMFDHCQVLLADTVYVIGGSYFGSHNFKLTQDGWVEVASVTVARDNFACAVHFGKIFVISGNDADTELNSVEIFDPLSETWSFGPDFPLAVTHAQAFSWNGSLWVMGGWINTVSDYNNELYRLEGGSWKDTGIIVNENGAGNALPAQIVGRHVINC